MHDQIEIAIKQKISQAKNKGINPEKFCFTYARVSSDEQKDIGNSLDEQKSRLKKYVKEKNLFPLFDYSSSESAFKEGRFNFNHMLSMVEKYKIKIVVFKNYDRATRNDYDWPRVLKLIKNKVLVVHFYELNQILNGDSKAEEFFNADIQVAMAKYWSQKISQGVKSAYDNFLIEGTPVRASDGYMLAEGKPRRWIIDKSREKTIRRMFDLCVAGYSLRKIAEIMRSEKYLTKGTTNRKKKDKTPAPFTIASIERILKNPMYAGYYELNGELVKGNIEPYCTLEELEERKTVLDGRHCWNKGKGIDFVYRLFLYCPDCGKVFTGWTQRIRNKYEYIYYSHDCNELDGKSVKIKETRVKKLIDNKIKHFRFNNTQAEYLKNVLQNILTSESDIVKSERERINNKIASLISQRKNATGLFLEEIIPKEELTERVTAINKELANQQNILETLTDDLTIYNDEVTKIIDFLKNFNDLYDQLTEKERMDYVRCIVDKAYLDGEKIKFEFKKPFQHLLNEKTIKEMQNLGACNGSSIKTLNSPEHSTIRQALVNTLIDFSKKAA